MGSGWVRSLLAVTLIIAGAAIGVSCLTLSFVAMLDADYPAEFLAIAGVMIGVMILHVGDWLVKDIR